MKIHHLLILSSVTLWACGDKDTDTAAEEADTDTDTDADTDTDTDSDADTDTDTDSDTDTDTDTDTTPENLLVDASFEAKGLGGWLIYPTNLKNWEIISTGDTIYQSEETFTAYFGSASLKVYGQWSGWENETPVYQEFVAVEGESYTLTGWAWTHHDDPITAEHTQAYLSIKYFDDSYNFYGSSDSAVLSAGSKTDTWTQLTATGTVPKGATKVQAAIEFWQCKDDKSGGKCWDGNGAAYFDELTFSKN